MLLVKTKLLPSKIHGIGLFADQDIPKGTTIWRFKTGFDLRITKKDYMSLSKPIKIQLLHYGWLDKKTGNHYLSSDDNRFINHSKTPNCVAEEDGNEQGIMVASRNIKKDEELTEDYSSFDANFKSEADF